MNFSITRRGEYGITAALYLAGKDQTQLSQIHEIAKDCDLPEPFLAQILRLLVRGSLVDSRKGVNGGFRLARKAEEISFLEVLEALEGPVAVNRCQSHLGCEQKGFCSMEGVWTRAQTALLTVLSEAKLSEALIPGRYPHVKLEEAVTSDNNSGPTNGDESTVAK